MQIGNKIIFLDIDGVLNHEKFYKEFTEEGHDDMKEFFMNQIDPNSVKNLNILCDETGAKIVISSTWRHSGIEYCVDILTKCGLTGEIIDITPTLRDDCLRGNEILKWIKDNELLVGPYYQFTEYVILDDDSDMLYWQRNNFILIDRFVGLTMGNVFQAKRILNNGKILDFREL